MPHSVAGWLTLMDALPPLPPAEAVFSTVMSVVYWATEPSSRLSTLKSSMERKQVVSPMRLICPGTP